MSHRGAFIVIEGLDRSGKTTQTETIQKRIQEAGKEVVCIKFPDRSTSIGKMIDSYLRSQSNLDDHVVHLLFSANRWELASTILAHLKQGKVVLCDRYAFSGIAFSVAKNLPPINLAWARAPDASLPSPDLTLFLDISPEAAQSRGGYGEERYEKEGMQRRSQERISDGKGGGKGTWIIVDAGRDMSAVTEEMWVHIRPLLDGLDTPVGRLWD
ncbi:thymidylate kinase [Gymnopus androsaceus JB14]|uniref:Thymidylate kinase n=1 Tax=Gymnopus androsaceus JB14 TaxID=1447944 RepID=A0A6A4IBX6_9AGAR|nr:thymidylate kinase [Gymnopus androsaceus JB14]